MTDFFVVNTILLQKNSSEIAGSVWFWSVGWLTLMLWSFNKCSVSYSAGFTSSAFFLTHCFFNIFISIGNVCMTFFLRACLIGTPSKYGDYRPIPSLVSLLTGLQFIYLFVNLFNIYFSFSLSLYLILLLFFHYSCHHHHHHPLLL